MTPPPAEDPGRFNPALRNREEVLDLTRIDALIEELASEEEARSFLARVLEMLPHRARVLRVALEEGDPASAEKAVASLTSLAAKAGARQLERDGRLIEASLRAGHMERAQRLEHRIAGDITALTETLTSLLPQNIHAGPPENDPPSQP